MTVKRRTSKQPKEHKAYKYCGLPTEEQKHQFSCFFGDVRWLYNRMLADRTTVYQNYGEELDLTPAWYKHLSCCSWLKDCDSLALANVQMNLNSAFQRFFDKKGRYPTFKRKSSHHDSYTTNVVGNNISYSVHGRYLYLTLPKFKEPIRVIYHRPVKKDGKLKSVTVSREPDGKYYFSLLFEYPVQQNTYQIDPSNAVGLDMTMHGLFISSDGRNVEYPSFYRKTESRIAKEQRKLSHMKKGSSNYKKQCRHIAKLYAKTKHQRNDTLHKISRYLVAQYDIIGIEDLNMRGMSQSLNFGKSVSDKGWGTFVAMLSYKAKAEGKVLIKISKFFPSSQTCHECGCLSKITKDLAIREWTCPHCGHHHDRDHNAALNIKDEAVRIYCTE